MNYGYWYYLPTGELCYKFHWEDTNIDNMRFKQGNFFRTQAEAETNGKEIREKIMKERNHD